MKQNSTWDWLMDNLSRDPSRPDPFRSFPGRYYQSESKPLQPRTELSQVVINFWILYPTVEPANGVSRYTYWTVPYDLNIILAELFFGIIGAGVTSASYSGVMGRVGDPSLFVREYGQYVYQPGAGAVGEIDARKTTEIPGTGFACNSGDVIYVRREVTPFGGAGNFNPSCRVLTRQRTRVIA